MEIEKRAAVDEITKIIIAVVFLVVMVFAVSFLLGDKGAALLGSIKNLFRLGPR